MEDRDGDDRHGAPSYDEALDPTAADERQAEREIAEGRARVRREFLTALLSLPEGRAWLWEVLDEFDAFKTRFGVTPSGFPDPQGTLYRMGMKDAGWWLWTQLDDAAPELASLMRREASGTAPRL